MALTESRHIEAGRAGNDDDEATDRDIAAETAELASPVAEEVPNIRCSPRARRDPKSCCTSAPTTSGGGSESRADFDKPRSGDGIKGLVLCKQADERVICNAKTIEQ